MLNLRVHCIDSSIKDVVKLLLVEQDKASHNSIYSQTLSIIQLDGVTD